MSPVLAAGARGSAAIDRALASAGLPPDLPLVGAEVVGWQGRGECERCLAVAAPLPLWALRVALPDGRRRSSQAVVGWCKACGSPSPGIPR